MIGSDGVFEDRFHQYDNICNITHGLTCFLFQRNKCIDIIRHDRADRFIAEYGQNMLFSLHCIVGGSGFLLPSLRLPLGIPTFAKVSSRVAVLQFGFFIVYGYQYHMLLIFPSEVNGYNGQRYLHIFVYISYSNPSCFQMLLLG